MTKEIEVLKMALEFVEDHLRHWSGVGRSGREVVAAIKEVLAHTEPWEKFCDSNCVWTDHHPDCKMAQRTWAGLTDEDIGICLDAGNGSMSKIISFIEAKLKEKNT